MPGARRPVCADGPISKKDTRLKIGHGIETVAGGGAGPSGGRTLGWQAPVFLLLSLVAALTLSAFAAGAGVLAWDVAVSRFVQRAPETGVGDAARVVNALGETPVMLALGGGLAVALLALRRTGPALVLLAAGLASAANPVLKALIESPRPTADLVRVAEQSSGQGFPSGHVMKVVLIYGAIWWLSRDMLPWRGPRLLVQGWAVGMIVATGFSRVYVGAHWPSDVVGGYLWSGLLLGVLAIGYRRVSAIGIRSLANVAIGGERMTTAKKSVRSRRIGVRGAGLLLAMALAVGLAGTLAAQAPLDERTWPAQIRAGTCEELGAPAFDLNPVGAARSDDDDNERDDMPGGAYVGATGAVQVATSGTEIVRTGLDDLLAQPHSVVVTAAGDETIVACGEIGGYLRGGEDLFIGLKEHDGSGITGVALIDGDDDNEVGVTIYLTEGAAAPSAAPTA